MYGEAAWVGAIALAAGLAHLPFLTAPLGSDEGGFLMVAAQWAPGSSLYGDYWVDRPPLLIGFFALADLLGGAVALRLLGIATIILSVLAAGRVGRLMSAPDAGVRSGRMAAGGTAVALTAAIFLANPLFGTAEVNGEMISVAAILSSMSVGLTASRTSGSTRSRWLTLAGAFAASAVFVKQNQVDAFIFLIGLVAVTARHGAPGRRLLQGRRDLGAIAFGAAATGALVIAVAALRGTPPVALWDAMVTFRVDASVVLQSTSFPATGDRLWRLLGVMALTGAPLLILQLLNRLRSDARSRSMVGHGHGHDLRWVPVAVLAWESISVIGGGSYWLHYLICLVPGLVLAVAVTSAARRADTPRGRPGPARLIGSPFAALAYSGAVAAVALTSVVASPSQGSTEDPTSIWLAAHAAPNDTALVAYGHPNTLQGAGLDSPYPYLWSLIVRVKDPTLSLLASTLGGDERPDWLITGSDGLHGWGIDPTAGDEQLAEHYRPVATVDDHVIYLQRSRQLS